MTRFQIERAVAFDGLVQKWQHKYPTKDYSQDELIKKAEFVALMKLSKKAKRENQQTNLF
jgi:hypothetical protein